MCFQFLTHEDLSNGTGEQSTSAMKTPVKTQSADSGDKNRRRWG